MRSDAVRSPACLDVRDHFALQPRQVGIHGEHHEDENGDLDDRNDEERVLVQEFAHGLASASGRDCIMVQKRAREPLVKRVSLAERMS